jgi:peptidoglycan/LPS O-acetylase OafA/YrhL
MDVGGDARGDLPAPDSWKILGGLRFTLAMIVLFGHLGRFVPDEGAINKGLLLFDGLGAVAAVFCFLVISGFSIAHSITVAPRGYFRRRMIRIYPLYVLSVLLALLPFLFIASPIRTAAGTFELSQPGTILGNLFLLQAFVVHPLDSNAPLWTLAVEVCCYLLAPLFVRARRILLLAIIAASAMAYAAFPKLDLGFYSSLLFGLPLLFMIWAWLAGFVLYFHRADRRYWIAILCLGTLLFSTNRAFMTRFSIFTYVGTVALILFSDGIKLPRNVLKLLNYAGELSYPVYIFHVPVLLLCYAVLGVRSSLMLVGAVLLCSAFFYHVVDQPIRKRRKVRRQPDVQPEIVPVPAP